MRAAAVGDAPEVAPVKPGERLLHPDAVKIRHQIRGRGVRVTRRARLAGDAALDGREWR